MKKAQREATAALKKGKKKGKKAKKKAAPVPTPTSITSSKDLTKKTGSSLKVDG